MDPNQRRSRLGADLEDVGGSKGTGLKYAGCRLGDGRELIGRGLGTDKLEVWSR